VPPANVSRLSDHVGNGLVDLLFDRQVLRVEINEWDFHGKAAKKIWMSEDIRAQE